MRLRERDHRTGPERDDVDVHVVAQVGRVNEAGGHPGAIGAWHRDGFEVTFVGDKRRRHLEAIDLLISLPDPVEAEGVGAGVVQGPACSWRQERVAAALELVLFVTDRQHHLAVDDEEHSFRLGIVLGQVAAAAGGYLDDVLRKGLGEAGQRAGQHPEPGVGPVR
jgi:hypothetical protein